MKMLFWWAAPTFTELDWFAVNTATIGVIVISLIVYNFWIKEV